MPLVPLDEMVLAGQGVPTLSLDGMDLRGGSLASAALINVSCDGTNSSGVPMDAAILAGADLRGAIGVTLEQILRSHAWNDRTRFPLDIEAELERLDAPVDLGRMKVEERFELLGLDPH